VKNARNRSILRDRRYNDYALPGVICMLKDVVNVQVLEDGYRLQLKFEDGVEGIVDISLCVPFTGVFAPLQDSREFAAVRVNPELGTICWPCGADMDPDVLYSLVTEEPTPSYDSVAEHF
jgi:hypothetical protein